MTRHTDDPAIKKSVSFPSKLLARGQTRARSLGYNLSQYCQHLMRDDLLHQEKHLTRIAEDDPGRFKAKKQVA